MASQQGRKVAVTGNTECRQEKWPQRGNDLPTDQQRHPSFRCSRMRMASRP